MDLANQGCGKEMAKLRASPKGPVFDKITLKRNFINPSPYLKQTQYIKTAKGELEFIKKFQVK